MAEEHGVFGPALLGAELLGRASILSRHQLLGHRVAVDAGVTVFPPVFSQVVSEEEFTAWEECLWIIVLKPQVWRHSCCHLCFCFFNLEVTSWKRISSSDLAVTLKICQGNHDLNQTLLYCQFYSGRDRDLINAHWSWYSKYQTVSLPSLQKKQSLLLILLASLVIFSILQYSHREVTKLVFLNSWEQSTLHTKTILSYTHRVEIND